MEKTMVDFFISRAGEDAEIAQRVDRIVRADGYKTFVQDKDFGHADFMAKMDEGFAYVDKGARLIAILTRSYLAKDHCLKEANHPLIDDPQNKRQKLIVLRASECAPTGMLKAVRYTDLVPHLDNDEAFISTVRNAVSTESSNAILPTESRINKLLLVLETKDEQDVEKTLNWSVVGITAVGGLWIAFNSLLAAWNEWFGTYYYPLFDTDLILMGAAVFLALLVYSYNQQIQEVTDIINQQKLTVEQLRELRDRVHGRDWRSKNVIKSAVSRAIVSMVDKR
jgi:hypothetical protein